MAASPFFPPNNIMSGCLPIIKLRLETISGSLLNLELNPVAGAIADSD